MCCLFLGGLTCILIYKFTYFNLALLLPMGLSCYEIYDCFWDDFKEYKILSKEILKLTKYV